MTDPDRSPLTAVLWDIDGTLLSSGGVAVGAFLDAVRDVVGTRPEGRDLDLGGRIDPEIASALLRSVGSDDRLVPQVLDRLQENATARIEEFRAQVQVLPGVVQTLRKLQAAGVRQTVVTGNIESVGRIKLSAAGLVPPIDPALGGFGDSGRTRVEVAQVALRRLTATGWPVARDRCWIVGDTPRDVLCAQALGLRCALVATGRHSAESLAGLGADIVVPSLEQADTLWASWNLDPGPNPTG